jgi:hypothetical protein
MPENALPNVALYCRFTHNRYMYFGVTNPQMTRMVAAARNRGHSVGQIMHEIRKICRRRYRKVNENHDLLRSKEFYQPL